MKPCFSRARAAAEKLRCLVCWAACRNEGLLKLFIRNRGYSEGLPHKTLLQVFELLGNDHPLVTVYRRKLFAALY